MAHTDPESQTSTQLRASLAVNAASTRESGLYAARALIRKYGIQDAAELLALLDCIAHATCKVMVGTAEDQARDRLINIACDLEDSVDAPNNLRCPTYSVGNLRRGVIERATALGQVNA